MTDTAFSARRGRLASFENAYAVAVQRREDTGADQYVIATGNPVQPFRVSRHEPAPTDTVYAMVA
ncbi:MULTISPECIES: hypothetical protein [Sphingomonas]|jgi:hypothetical protein|uniref:Uncharacterized protein n=1 Tax=Sphingomonas abaci TaxID=237611 RepID=A0A7W7F1A7_9SPHN|nr:MULTISPECIES: hypothetical protein [Sphingomonas]PZP27610.1 MAG: hypothetical protein DI613_13755 [Kocuria rhizophila]ATI56845.1 hypothetical protein CP552_14515 [Sphingomonas melonis]MBB4619190.1 hypothetical protein [Sphingomonas abaci]MBX8846484.1 hypothetical protein [Sphingomonas melonis]MBX8855566.1 hypothetical protein [Sphingomonas melonis]